MTAVEEALERLAQKARELGEQASAVNAVLQRANTALAATHPGVEVWLEPANLPNGGLRMPDGDDLISFTLGYTKNEEQWGLAVRYLFAEGEESVTIPIEKSRREIRIQACALLPALIDELSRHTDRLIAEIGQAFKPTRRQAKP